MDLKQQYLEEKQQNKEERIKRIIEVAKIEFAKNGIVNTKLSIIAREAHVGEATIYRYFTDKIQLIKLVALDYWKNQVIIFKNYLDENIEVDSDGLSKVKVYLDIFIELYHSHKNFLKFMEDFD
ncbi:MAG: helix-turn-helix transcriptional regulator, partial [Candidatus Izimaplasma sp.]|nr:helix-turn-helix transcriptional regulator [Candidatus Izimaplasma bacterium]